MRKLLLCLALLWAFGSGAAFAASGTALVVDQGADAKTKAETRVLTVGADIFIGDSVNTDAKGLVQIL